MAWFKGTGWGGDAEGWAPPLTVAWSPLDLGAKLLHFSDPLVSGCVTTSGGNATAVNDLSSANNDLAPTGGNVAFDVNAFATGKSGYSFIGSGGGTLLGTGIAHGVGSAVGVATVATLNTGTATSSCRLCVFMDPAVANDYSDPTGALLITRDALTTTIAGYRNGVGTLASGSVTNNTRFRVISELDGSNHQFRLNGSDQSPVGTSGSIVSSGATLTIGGGVVGFTPGTDPWGGKVGPIVLWKTALTSGEKDSLDAWLAAWGT